MEWGFDRRLALGSLAASLVVTLFGIGITILWPNVKVLGWALLILGCILFWVWWTFELCQWQFMTRWKWLRPAASVFVAFLFCALMFAIRHKWGAIPAQAEVPSSPGHLAGTVETVCAIQEGGHTLMSIGALIGNKGDVPVVTNGWAMKLVTDETTVSSNDYVPSSLGPTCRQGALAHSATFQPQGPDELVYANFGLATPYARVARLLGCHSEDKGAIEIFLRDSKSGAVYSVSGNIEDIRASSCVEKRTTALSPENRQPVPPTYGNLPTRVTELAKDLHQWSKYRFGVFEQMKQSQAGIESWERSNSGWFVDNGWPPPGVGLSLEKRVMQIHDELASHGFRDRELDEILGEIEMEKTTVNQVRATGRDFPPSALPYSDPQIADRIADRLSVLARQLAPSKPPQA